MNKDISTTTKIKSIQLDLADSMTRYAVWPAPTIIVSDGPYGLGIFPGEPQIATALAEWYEPHISEWAKYALPETTLWFWCKAFITAEQWEHMRAKWNHMHSFTNVWSEPAVRGDERIKDNKARIVHANQKPLRLIERIITASSDPEDVVWEPFGGLCSAAVASLRTNRHCFSAESNPDYYTLARTRMLQEGATTLWEA